MHNLACKPAPPASPPSASSRKTLSPPSFERCVPKPYATLCCTRRLDISTLHLLSQLPEKGEKATPQAAWPDKSVLLRRSHRSRRRCIGSHLRGWCGIDLYRSQNLLQPLENFLAIHVFAAFVSLNSGGNLEREFVASPILEHVIILRCFLASPVLC